MSQGITQKITVYVLAFLSLAGFVYAADIGLSKEEVFKCQEIVKETRNYDSFKTETWKMNGCEAHGFKLSI